MQGHEDIGTPGSMDTRTKVHNVILLIRTQILQQHKDTRTLGHKNKTKNNTRTQGHNYQNHKDKKTEVHKETMFHKDTRAQGCNYTKRYCRKIKRHKNTAIQGHKEIGKQ